MKTGLMTLALVLFGSQAHATGGFWCDFKKHGYELTINGVTSRSFANAIVSAEAQLKGPAAVSFDRSHILQYWNEGDEFRAILYKEEEGDSYKWTRVELRTTSPDQCTFSGKLKIEHFDGTKVHSLKDADVECSLE